VNKFENILFQLANIPMNRQALYLNEAFHRIYKNNESDKQKAEEEAKLSRKEAEYWHKQYLRAAEGLKIDGA
jgi:hypothetical protein